MKPLEEILPKQVSEAWLATNFSQFQRNLRNDRPEHVIINVADVEWFDPLPVIFFLAELKRHSLKNQDSVVHFDLGEWGTGPHNVLQHRSLVYLVSHGFIDALRDHIGNLYFRYRGYHDNQSVLISASSTAEFDQLKTNIIARTDVTLAYGPIPLVPPTVLSITRWQLQLVDLINGIDDNYFRPSVSRRAVQETSLQRLHEVLHEFVKNAFEHAYQNESEISPVIVYVRDQYPVKRPIGSPPRLGASLFQEHPETDWIEVFVCDVGQGIFADAEIWLDEKCLKPNCIADIQQSVGQINRASSLGKLLFKEPLSRINRTSVLAERGITTGLIHINSVLSHQGDITFCFADNAIIYDRHPFSGNPKRYIENSPQIKMYGLGIKTCLFLQPPTTRPAHWFFPSKYQDEIEIIRSKIISGSFLAIEQQVIDLRAANSKLLIPSEGYSELITRLPRRAPKNTINQIINAWLLNSILSISKSRVLILTDISRTHALAIESIILAQRNERFQGAGEKRLFIFVLADDCSFFGVKIEIRKNGVANRSSVSVALLGDSYNNKIKQTKFITDRIASTLINLRISDSVAFWNIVSKLETGGSKFRYGPVRWTPSITINTYLDFSFAMQNEDLSRIVRYALRRLSALFPYSVIRYLDKLIEPEALDANWVLREPKNESKKNPDDAQVLLIGSIRVTGQTLDRYLQLYPRANYVLECFLLPSDAEIPQLPDSIVHIAALNWLEAAHTNSAPEYEHEPGTPFIRKIELDTTSFLSLDKMGEPSYSQSPHKMYDYFVSNRIIKVGHWHYGDRHSLVEVNVALVIDKAIATQHRGLFAWLSQTLEAYYAGATSRLLVYPPHRLSAKMVKAFKKYASTELTNSIQFVPAHMTPSVAGGAPKLADISRSRIENAIPFPLAGARAVILDIGFNSKRTLRYLRRQLVLLGHKSIRAVGLFNRSSAPGTPMEEPISSISSYWRWNLPILGRPNQCQVCSALRTIRKLRHATEAFHTDLSLAIEKIILDWELASLESQWFDHGVDPQKLSIPKQTHFGFKDGDYGKELASRFPHEFERDSKLSDRFWHIVTHRYATTLTAHYVEIARYGGNAEKLLLVIKEGNVFSAQSSVEALCIFLCLCQDLVHWIKISYLNLLIEKSINLDLIRQGVSPDKGKTNAEDIDIKTEDAGKLLQLSAIVICGIDECMARAMLPCVVLQLSKYILASCRTHALIAPSPEIRVLVMSLRPPDEIHTLLINSSELLELDSDERRVLEVNRLYAGLAHSQRPAKDIWRDLDLHFGRGNSHDGAAYREIVDAVVSRNRTTALKAANSLIQLLGSKDGGLFQRINLDAVKATKDLVDICNRCSSMVTVKTELLPYVEKLRGQFREHLIRCQGPSPAEMPTLVHQTMLRSLLKLAGISVSSFASGEYVFQNEDQKFPESNVLPWCQLVVDELIKHVSNAQQYSSGLTWPRIKFCFSATSNGIEIIIENTCHIHARQAKNRTPKFLSDIGGEVKTSLRSAAECSIYQVNIFLPWLNTIIQ